MTTAEMRARLDSLLKVHHPNYEDFLSRNYWLLDLASAELARREREEKIAALNCPNCGHSKWCHTHATCGVRISGGGRCLCAEKFVDSPVTDIRFINPAVIPGTCEGFVGGSMDNWPELCDRCGRHYEMHIARTDSPVMDGEAG